MYPMEPWGPTVKNRHIDDLKKMNIDFQVQVDLKNKKIQHLEEVNTKAKNDVEKIESNYQTEIALKDKEIEDLKKVDIFPLGGSLHL